MNTIQYTIRNIPPAVDRVIRRRASQSGKSFNQTVVDLLALQTFGTTKPEPAGNLARLFGKNTLDDSFDAAIRDQSQIDEKLWH